MIDVQGVIFDPVARAILAEYPDAYVSNQAMVAPAAFPAVELRVIAQAEVRSARDSSGEENANEYSWQAQVYDDSEDSAEDTCWRIAQIIDEAMRRMNATRTFLQPLDNASDPDIFRLVGRWGGVIDSENILYWR